MKVCRYCLPWSVHFHAFVHLYSGKPIKNTQGKGGEDEDNNNVVFVTVNICQFTVIFLDVEFNFICAAHVTWVYSADYYYKIFLPHRETVITGYLKYTSTKLHLMLSSKKIHMHVKCAQKKSDWWNFHHY